VVSKPIGGDIFEGIAELSRVLKIDLIVLSPQSTSIKDEVYLGIVTTKIIRQTKTPLIVVPKDYLFRRFDAILFAMKNVKIESTEASDTLVSFIDHFNAKLNVLRVVTPDTAENYRTLQPELMAIAEHIKISENATVFQGITEHFSAFNPELLCVLQRKNKDGFFKKTIGSKRNNF
jgi:hypothetical protein